MIGKRWLILMLVFGAACSVHWRAPNADVEGVYAWTGDDFHPLGGKPVQRFAAGEDVNISGRMNAFEGRAVLRIIWRDPAGSIYHESEMTVIGEMMWMIGLDEVPRAGWARGIWQAEIYINDQLKAAVPFLIGEGVGT